MQYYKIISQEEEGRKFSVKDFGYTIDYNNLWQGNYIKNWSNDNKILIKNKNLELDITDEGLSGCLLITEQVKSHLTKEEIEGLQFLPVKIYSGSYKTKPIATLYLLNILNLEVDVINENVSEKLPGLNVYVNYKIDAKKVRKKSDIFRVKGNEEIDIYSEKIKKIFSKYTYFFEFRKVS